MAVGVGPMELLWSFVMLFGSGLGLPLGVPPMPEDELLARVAPQECLFYTSWSGMADADPKSENQTEQLIAEAEIQQLAAALTHKLTAAMNQVAGRDGSPQARLLAGEGPQLLKLLLTRPTALYVSDVKLDAGGPQIEAGLLINVGDEAGNVRAALEKLQTAIAGDRVAEVPIAGAKFFRFQPAPQAPPITWGTRGKYLIAGLGNGAVEALLQRVRSAPPAWLTELRQRLPVARVSTVTYANVGKMRELVTALAGKPELGQVLEALGLKSLTALGSVTGLDATGFVSRTSLGFDGQPRGLLTPLAAESLTAEDLAPIPHDALAAAAWRLDVGQLLDAWLQALRQVDPRTAEALERELGRLEQGLKVRLRDDLLQSLGDVWTISTAPSEGGPIAGWLATVRVRDRQRLSAIHETLLRQAGEAFGKGPRAPQIRQAVFSGQTIYYLVVPEPGFPLTPAWCLTEDRLVVGLFPQALKSYLSRGAGYRSLAEQAAVQPLLATDTKPLAIAYADTRELFRTFYPLLQVGVQVALRQAPARGLDFDPALLPSTGAIEKHLLPYAASVRRTAAGIELTSHGTLPGNIGSSAPVALALILPAVQAAREAARRTQGMNNLKQIALAMHNFHDMTKNFPAAYNSDKEGRPLLSWRVHLLPFLEQQALYKQFHLDEPWDSDHNRPLAARMPQIFRAPGSQAEAGKTVYLGVRGDKMVFVSPKTPGTPIREERVCADILDGTSNTIMIVEASDAAAVVWTKPDDFEPKEENPIQGLVGVRPGGFSAAFCDGSVRFIAANIDRVTLWRLFIKADGQAVTLP